MSHYGVYIMFEIRYLAVATMDFVFFFIDNLYPSTTLNIKVMINIFIEKYANPKKSKYLNLNFPSTEFENKSCSV